MKMNMIIFLFINYNFFFFLEIHKIVKKNKKATKSISTSKKSYK
jgi:hypothetical protein